jgi:entericidin B
VDYFKKLLSVLAIAGSLAGTLSLIACNTVHGLGEDIERGGQKTQDAADAVKKRL